MIDIVFSTIWIYIGRKLILVGVSKNNEGSGRKPIGGTTTKKQTVFERKATKNSAVCVFFFWACVYMSVLSREGISKGEVHCFIAQFSSQVDVAVYACAMIRLFHTRRQTHTDKHTHTHTQHAEFIYTIADWKTCTTKPAAYGYFGWLSFVNQASVRNDFWYSVACFRWIVALNMLTIIKLRTLPHTYASW